LPATRGGSRGCTGRPSRRPGRSRQHKRRAQQCNQESSRASWSALSRKFGPHPVTPFSIPRTRNHVLVPTLRVGNALLGRSASPRDYRPGARACKTGKRNATHFQPGPPGATRSVGTTGITGCWCCCCDCGSSSPWSSRAASRPGSVIHRRQQLGQPAVGGDGACRPGRRCGRRGTAGNSSRSSAALGDAAPVHRQDVVPAVRGRAPGHPDVLLGRHRRQGR